VRPEHRLPKQQASLAALASCSPPAATPFHCDHYPAGHTATNFAKWHSASAPYPVQYEDGFEPYMIASRTWLPRYDDAFTGYGMNKVSHVYAVAAAGGEFVVMPRHFVAAHEHPKSSSWHATFGDHADPTQRMRVAALYRRLRLTCPLPPTVDSGTEGAPAERTLLRPPPEGVAVLTRGTFTRGTKRCAAETSGPPTSTKRHLSVARAAIVCIS